MAEIQSNIRINIDTVGALASLKNLQGQISAFHSAMAKSGAAAAANSANLQSNLINSINASGKFAASMTTVKSTTEAFTTSLERNKLSMTEYFKYAGGASKSFGRLFASEFATINKVAVERVKDLQTQYIKMGRDANGAMQAIKVRPLALDMNNLSTQTQIAAQKQQILNQLLKQGSTNLLNFGKNTQWAGRQLMVGFSIPLMMVGTAAAKTYMAMEKQSLMFRRVYGDLNTTDQEIKNMIGSVRQLGNEFTQFGLAASDTMGLAAKIAAMGKTGADLLAQVRETSRMAALGGVTQDQALQTTISLTNAFGVSAKDLATNVDFLNYTQNQTVLSLEDMTTAIPKAAPVVRQLGGNVKDLAFFLTAMKEGGVNAAEGANAIKSGLASIINPTRAASDFLAKFNINLSGIVNANRGNIKGTVIALGDALNKLDPLNRAQAIEKLFGKFQFSRISALLKNVTDANSQASKVSEIGAKSKAELAILSERELKRVAESPMNKFNKALQDLKVSLIPLGEQFLKAVTPIAKFITQLLKQFNGLGEGTKSTFANIAIWVGGLAPIALMVFGLFANGIANIIKGFAFVKSFLNNIGKGTLALGEQTHYLTQEQLNAEAASASLDQAHQKLKQTFTSEAEAVDILAASYAGAVEKQMIFSGTFGSAKRPPFPKFASGGFISGPGSGTSDSIIARVSNGEAIIPANSVAAHPQLVSQLINGNVPGFAYGGGYFAPKPYRSPAQIARLEEYNRLKAEREATPEGQAAKAKADARIAAEKKAARPHAIYIDIAKVEKLPEDSPILKEIAAAQFTKQILLGGTKGTWGEYRVSPAFMMLRNAGLKENRYKNVNRLKFKELMNEYKISTWGPMGEPKHYWRDSDRKYATGGIVSGPGTGTSDSITARISNGEAVIPAASVAANPDLVRGLIANNIPGFVKGRNAISVAGNTIDPYSQHSGDSILRLEQAISSDTEATRILSEAVSLLRDQEKITKESVIQQMKVLAANQNVSLPKIVTGSTSSGYSATAAGIKDSVPIQLEKERGSQAANAELDRVRASAKATETKLRQLAADFKELGITEKQIQSAIQIDRAHIIPVAKEMKKYKESWHSDLWIAQTGAENIMTESLRSSTRNRELYLKTLNELGMADEKVTAITTKINEGIALTDEELIIQGKVFNKILTNVTEDASIAKKVSPKFLTYAAAISAGAKARQQVYDIQDAELLTMSQRSSIVAEAALKKSFEINSPSRFEERIANQRAAGTEKGFKEAMPEAISEAKNRGLSFFRSIAATADSARIAGGMLPGMQNPIVASQVARGDLSGLLLSADALKIVNRSAAEYNATIIKGSAIAKERTLLEEQRNENLITGNEILDATVKKEKSRFSIFSYFEDRKAAKEAKQVEAMAALSAAEDRQAEANNRFTQSLIALKANTNEATIAEAIKAKAELEEAEATTITAAKVAGKANKTKASGLGGGMGAMMALSMLPMMATMMPGPIGKMAQDNMMPLMMLSMLPMVLPLLTNPIALAVAGLGALAFSIFQFDQAMQKGTNDGIKLAKSMSMTTDKLTSVSKLFGTVSATDIRKKEQQDQLTTMSKKQASEGDKYLNSSVGKSMLSDIKAQLVNGIPSQEIANNIATQLGVAVAQGVMTADQAKGIAQSLQSKLKNYKISAQITGELISIVGVNGKNFAANPSEFVSNIQSRNETNRKSAYQQTMSGVKDTSLQSASGWSKIGLGALSAGAGISGMVASTGAAPFTLGGSLVGNIPSTAAAGAGIAGIGLGVNDLIQVGATEAKNNKIRAIAVGLGATELEQNQGLIDSLNRQYDIKAKSLKKSEDLAQNEKDRQAALAKANANNFDSLNQMTKDALAMDKASPKSFGKAIGGSLNELYKNDPQMLALAKLAQGTIGSAKTSKSMKIKLDFALASGQLDPTSATTLAKFASDNKNYAKTLNMSFKTLGLADTNQLAQMLNMMDANKSTIDKVLNLTIKDPKTLGFLSQISQMEQVLGITININTLGQNGTADLETLIGQLKTIAALKTSGKLDLKTIHQKLIVDPQAWAAFKSNQKYFDGLKPEQKVTYLQAFITSMSTITDDEANAAYHAAHPRSAWGGSKLSPEDLAKQKATMAAKQAKLFNDAMTALGLGGGSTTPSGGGGSSLAAAQKAALKILQSEIDLINKKKKALEDVNKELDRQKQFEDAQMQRLSDMKQAMISGNYVQAAMIKQQSAYAKVQFDKETVSIKLQAQADALSQQSTAINNGQKVTPQQLLSIKKAAATLKASLATIGYASGGFISGPGTGTSDSILARVSNGEYVMNANAVSKIGVGNLNAMNTGSSTSSSSSVYNVTMTINGAGSNANDIADQVIRKLNNLSIKNNKTNRVGK